MILTVCSELEAMNWNWVRFGGYHDCYVGLNFAGIQTSQFSSCNLIFLDVRHLCLVSHQKIALDPPNLSVKDDSFPLFCSFMIIYFLVSTAMIPQFAALIP
jgi:hypothetical protein